jgi:hypothetical protein
MYFKREREIMRNLLSVRNRNLVWVVVVMLVLASLACLGSTEEPTAVPTEAPPPTPVPEEPEEPEVEGGSLDIANYTEEPICFVYISPADTEDWGPEQLGEGNVIAPGDTFTITNIPPAAYDIKAEDCNGDVVARNDGVKLGALDFTWTLGEQTGAELVLENRSGLTICYLYIVPDSSTGWGDDQLGDYMIASGEDHTITDIPPGTYDLRVESCEGQSAEQLDADIQIKYTWTITGDKTAELILENRSSVELCHLYISPAGSDNWGPDQLDDQTVPSGSDFTVTDITPGVYDLRVESCGGTSVEQRDADITVEFTWTITD